jgi:hypothetical protein
MIQHFITRLAIVCFISLTSISLWAQHKGELSNKQASKEAKALYAYIKQQFGKKILSGQMWSGWGIDELKYIEEVTGKLPAIRGMDFIHQRDNQKEVDRAIDWWKTGGIPTIMWHMGAPSIGDGYENSKKAIDIDKVFEAGTQEHNVFFEELKIKGDLLEQLKKQNVPVLWRPFHELNGNWFWWGKQGPEKFKKLWIAMYNYYVKERKLDNLIWVLCYTGKPEAAWYPGDQYVDIAGADTYSKDNGTQAQMYNEVQAIVGSKVPITYHECGIPPDPEKCKKEGVMWSWWMEWHTGHLRSLDKEYLRLLYNHDLIITKDELPNMVQAGLLKSK